MKRRSSVRGLRRQGRLVRRIRGRLNLVRLSERIAQDQTASPVEPPKKKPLGRPARRHALTALAARMRKG